MWFWKSKEKKMAEQQAKLSGLVRGIMSAVQSASDIAGQQHFDLFSNYFYEEDGKLVPKVVRIALVDGKMIDVPLICLINPASYHLSKMEIEMSVRLRPGEIKSAVEKGVDNPGAQRQSYHVEMGHAKSKDAVKILMTFTSDDSEPEALSRILEELQNGYIVASKNLPDRPVWMPDGGTGKIVNKSKALEPNDKKEDILNDGSGI